MTGTQTNSVHRSLRYPFEIDAGSANTASCSLTVPASRSGRPGSDASTRPISGTNRRLPAVAVVVCDDDAAERLRRQAEQEGITPAELARRLLTEATGQDPFAFFDVGSSEALRGERVDERLADHRFGEQ
jgi:hypothetical protein